MEKRNLVLIAAAVVIAAAALLLLSRTGEPGVAETSSAGGTRDTAGHSPGDGQSGGTGAIANRGAAGAIGASQALVYQSRGDQAPLPQGQLPDPSSRPRVIVPPRPDSTDYAKKLESYKKQTEYPLNSRPLGPDQMLLLEPNRSRPVRRPTGDPARKSRQEREQAPSHTYALTADPLAVVGDREAVVTLTVFEGKDGSKPVEARVLSAAVVASAVPGGDERTVASLVLNDAGRAGDARAGDLVYGGSFSPAKNAAVDESGRYGIRVVFEDPGGVKTTGLASLLYTAESSVPARFTGKFQEKVEQGSLLVLPELDVKKPGSYVVRANLFAPDGTPIAHSRFEGELQQGKRSVELLFFGKVFHDKAASGPYSLRGLYGYRSVPGNSPNREMMVEYKEAYETRRYGIAAFSASPWQSPEKAATIRRYEKLIEGGQE